MAVKSPGSRRRLNIGFGIAGLVVLIGVIAGATLLYGRAQLEAPAAAHGVAVAIDVRSGEPLAAVVADLDRHHLIRSTFWFSAYARYRGLGGQLHPGRFMLDPGMVASYLIARLAGPADIKVRRLTLAEGLTAAQMAARVASAGVGISAAAYLAEVKGGAFSEPFLAGRPPGAGLEGFLFPDTYDIPEHATAHDVVQLQLDGFQRRLGTLLGGSSRLPLYPTLVVASLVEREALFEADRPLVASVIYNRLDQGMNLGLEAPVLYGLGIVGRPPTATELGVDTPYNTYLHKGLPPTPIANPGVAAVAAAAHPATTAYVYYVSDDCGHNHYSVSAADHERQAALYVGTRRCGG